MQTPNYDDLGGFSDRLKTARDNYRREMGLPRFSQSDLADAIGSSTNAVAQWEQSVGLPTADFLWRLTKVLNVSADWLLNGGIQMMTAFQAPDWVKQLVRAVREYPEAQLLFQDAFQHALEKVRRLTPMKAGEIVTAEAVERERPLARELG